MANSVPERHERGSEIILSDRLSNLSDDLLRHILSFLPTKDAIATSLLSKRWMSLWIGLPILHFDDSSFRSSESFFQFVECALKFFPNFNHIQIFRLKGSGIKFGPRPDKIISWVKEVINKLNELQVDELELCFTSWSSIRLASSIFNCSTLKVLRLKDVKVDTLSSVNLPSLKVLHLESVMFLEFRCLVMLLAGCPLLEELKLSSFALYYYNQKTNGIYSLEHYLVSSNNPSSSFLVTLKKFCVDQFKGLGLRRYSDEHERSFRNPKKVLSHSQICTWERATIRILKLNGVKVTTPSFIHLPSLEVLHLSNVIFPNIQGVYNLLCGCPLLQDLSLKYCSAILIDGRSIVPIKEGSLRNLVSAHVYRYPFTLEERLKNLVLADVYRYPFTLRSLSNVTALRIDTIGFSSPLDIPKFYNLTHMEIRCCPGVSGTTLLECLRNCPKLETLKIDEFNSKEPSGNNVPQCVSSNLKEFHLGNYRGLHNEFELARFIMEEARVLKIISIRTNSKANSEQEIMLKRLSSCNISSANCRLLFNSIPKI
ncbi:FBD-associated F-box protein At4g10400-like [Neltuma alba]|uniref:FBD-associated F-box protein At4g10400-like n=1 Tax=Neltuma alba TaxID=207710 RepID=UPI0010A591C2|nr:FBD-associated F-box protein At4g10400-like [Prosopis alba]